MMMLLVTASAGLLEVVIDPDGTRDTPVITVHGVLMLLVLLTMAPVLPVTVTVILMRVVFMLMVSLSLALSVVTLLLVWRKFKTLTNAGFESFMGMTLAKRCTRKGRRHDQIRSLDGCLLANAVLGRGVIPHLILVVLSVVVRRFW